MRVRNVWFDLLSFIVAVLMLAFAVFYVLEYVRGDHASLVSTVISVGIFLLFAAVYLWMSLRVGNTQRKIREVKKERNG